jgi:rSAM/selenodomain-associated transferase 1
VSTPTQLIVLAKAPVAGYAKTRLIGALGAEGAARLAARLLEHTMQAARAVRLGPLLLACAPDATHPAFAAQAERGDARLVAQGEGDLGARMQRGFEMAFAAGAARALLIGTDAPALDATMLRQADAALARAGVEAVFIPALDGGYVLIGLRQPQPSLFHDMPWSSPRVMALTRERLATAGLHHEELAAVQDIDEPADLAHLPAGWV